MIRIAGIGIAGALLAVLLRQQRPELAPTVSLATGVVVLAMVLSEAFGLVESLRDMAERFSIDMDVISTVLRITGVAYIAEFGVQACIDAGEMGIASKVELGAKVLIMGMCVPIAVNILDVLTQMLP